MLTISMDQDPCCERCGGGLGGPQFAAPREFECSPCAYERRTGRSWTDDVDSGEFALWKARHALRQPNVRVL